MLVLGYTDENSLGKIFAHKLSFSYFMVDSCLVIYGKKCNLRWNVYRVAFLIIKYV